MSAESKIAGDRISAAQLAEIEKRAAAPKMHRAHRRDVAILVAEVWAAWGEADAATRALRELVEACDYYLELPNPVFDDALAAARALVGSENRGTE